MDDYLKLCSCKGGVYNLRSLKYVTHEQGRKHTDQYEIEKKHSQISKKAKIMQADKFRRLTRQHE